MKFLVAVVTCSVLLTGAVQASQSCPSAQAKPELHSLYIDRLGRLNRLDGSVVSREDEADHVKKIADNIKALRHENPALKITVFIHGGLNTFENAVKRPLKFSQGMLCEGHYPIFISWNSGFPTNYLDHVWRIREGEHEPVKGFFTLPFVFAEDVGRSVVRIPAAIYKEVAGPFKVSIWRYTQEERFADQRRIALQKTSINVVDNPPFRGVARSYWNGSVLNPLKFVTAPFADGLGSGAWNAMLRRTDHVLSRQLAFEGDICPECYSSEEADTAVTMFFRLIAKDDDLNKEGSLLVGHSMGTIIANNILIRHPEIKFSNVVYMGAAASIKEVESAVTPWLRLPQNKSANFYNLSLDPYRELSESHLFDTVPRGSLLNWIDYIYGDVNSFKDRTAGSWWNMLRLAQDIFPAEVQSRVYLTRFPIGGRAQGPQKHGEFGDYCFWRESFWKAKVPLAIYSESASGCES